MGGCHVENNRRKQKDSVIILEGTINSTRKIDEEEKNFLSNNIEEKKANDDNDLIKSQENKENIIVEKDTNENNIIEDNNKNNEITENRFMDDNNKNNDLIAIEKTENDDNKINYWLICPDCSERSPHIEKLYYDKNTNNFSVKYSCICHDNMDYPKEALLSNIISNQEPQNLCIIHPEQKLINFCKNCGKAICNICKSENHYNHILEENNGNFSKED